MAIISVTPEQLKEQSAVYLRARDGIENELQNVNKMNSQIAEQWKGQAFTAYLDQYAQLSAQVKKFEELLIDINAQLNKYAQTIQQRDQEDSKSFGLK